ncbi:transporter substrate-binding domain-containing protein [Pseudomonas putida]|uniref:transporter substrate-binding domain-containing protein n=1 Tax=Pseudomonas putida TaxID=303 RepID=UPI00300F1E3D
MKFYKNILVAAVLVSTGVAHADQIDDVIDKGVLRCAVSLDFAPMGMRDENNQPAGFDVDTCKDLAASLKVKAEIVDTPFADRIPALMSDRADVTIASTSDTMERAQTVGFSIPYAVFQLMIVKRKGTDITTYESLKGHPVGGTAGTFEGDALQADVKKWNDAAGSYRQYQNQADLFLALEQGKIDAILVANTISNSLIKSGKYPNIEIAGVAPIKPDFTSIVVKRKEYGMLNYVNLFINRQYREGRYAELWGKWVGGEAPKLIADGVYR